MNYVFLLEEPSARELIESIFSKIVPVTPGTQVFYMIFQGKQDLEKNIEVKIKGWQLPDSLFVVLRDQDSGDCKDIKLGLSEKVRRTGKDNFTIVRIACRELESWYFGDLQAVEEALEIPGLSQKYSNKAQYRNPDSIVNPSAELIRITDHKYQKLSGSREIGTKINLERNKSASFKAFLSGIRKLNHQSQ